MKNRKTMNRAMNLTIQLILMIIIITMNNNLAAAQDVRPQPSSIELSGTINCINPINGTLSLVVIHNINQDLITLSDQNGAFNISMGKGDTVVFSTPEHLDYVYTLSPNEEFVDHKIRVELQTDAVWLDAVTILGLPTIESFKQEILLLDYPSNEIELTTPLVNKYAEQLKTGDGRIDLIGPLTYLQNKFSRYGSLKKQVNK